MAIKIISERQIVPGNEAVLNQLLLKLRARVVNAEGYISGETWRDRDVPGTTIVISTWESLEDWENWLKDDERKRIASQIDGVLVTPTTYRILVRH